MSVHEIKNHGKWVWQARVAYQGKRMSTFFQIDPATGKPVIDPATGEPKPLTSKNEALDARSVLLRRLKREAGQAQQEGQRPATLRRLLEFYVADLEDRRKGPDTIGRAVSTAKAIERQAPQLLDMPLSRLTARDILQFAAARAREGKVVRERRADGTIIKRSVPAQPETINRDLRTFRAALKKALPDFRFPGAAFFPVDNTRVRWLRPDEEITVFAAMPHATRPTRRTDSRPLPFPAMAHLAALTLMRLSEIRCLRRDYVHLEQGVVMLPRAKGGARSVILSQAAQKLLQHEIEAHPDAEYVFPNPDGKPYSRVHVSRVFRKASRSSGLKDFHFHDLRHHGATMALNAGFSAPVVQDLGGWKSEKMMRRYAAVTDQTLRAAAEAVSGAEPMPGVTDLPLSPKSTTSSRTTG